jgi:hypothetical protein
MNGAHILFLLSLSLPSASATSISFDNFGVNEQNPTFGASNQPYQWSQVEPKNANQDPKNRQDTLPSPRLVSNTLSNALASKPEDILSMLVPWWATIITNDVASQAARNVSDPQPIQVPTGDPNLDDEAKGDATLKFFRSTRLAAKSPLGEGFIQIENTLSSVIDVTAIYGVSSEVRIVA